MARWNDVVSEATDLATRAQRLFDAHRHKTVATLRRDGSPRISGTEATFVDGDLWRGMMDGSRKALDLRRDPRMALHSATIDPEMADGDAKLSGRTVEITDSDEKAAFMRGQGDDATQQFHLFRVDVTEVVVTRVAESRDHLVIEVWREGAGVRRVARA
jgi:hypothetical protein